MIEALHCNPFPEWIAGIPRPVNDNCNPVFREGLAQKLLDRQDRLALVQERIGVVSGNLDDRVAREQTVAARKAELETILAGVPETNVIRIDALTARIANLDERLTTLGAAIDRLTTRLPELAARETRLIEAIARISARVERLNTICDDPNTPPPANMTGGETGNNVITLSFLHSDHLGRPKFATRADGTVSWDGGITTPFGMQITALAAQTQALMFPGQYEDAETTGAGVTLSHNWHRTYDPTLGRYLQSDPIGLAGGLNRYAYVGGNPMGYVDSDGLNPLAIVGQLLKEFGKRFAKGAAIGGGLELAQQFYKSGYSFECLDIDRLTIAAIGGGVGNSFKLKSKSPLSMIFGAQKNRKFRKRLARLGLDKFNRPGFDNDVTNFATEGLQSFLASYGIKTVFAEPFDPCACLAEQKRPQTIPQLRGQYGI